MATLRKLLILLVLFFPTLASAGAGGCTTTSGSSSSCLDYSGSVWTIVGAAAGATAVNNSCTNAGGAYSSGGCPTTGLVGKCMASNRVYATDSYYYGGWSASVASLSSSCAATGTWYGSASSSSPIITDFLSVTTGVAADGAITGTVANVATQITVNATDIGKTGSVFVTAMVPSSSIGTTLAMRGENRPRTMALNSLVLANLTSTGWQAVANGQMIPYSTGVLGEQSSAINILNNADTASLAGSEFCVGYGTSVTEMNSTGRIKRIAYAPGSTATSATAKKAGCILISNARLFTWAEALFPSIFAGTGTDGRYQQFDYRLYSTAQNALLVDTSGLVHVYGSVTSNALTAVGQVESFRTQITAWEATR